MAARTRSANETLSDASIAVTAGKRFFDAGHKRMAYLKAIGEGLNVPPDNVEVSFIPGKEPGPKKLSGNAHAAKRWFVKIVVPGDDYVGAGGIIGGHWHVEMTALNMPSFLLDERFRSSFA
jgi:hypothetical protein